MNHQFLAKHPYPPKCLDAQEPSFWGETLASARTLTLGRNPLTGVRTPLRGEWQLGVKPPSWVKIARTPKSLEQGKNLNQAHNTALGGTDGSALEESACPHAFDSIVSLTTGSWAFR